MMTCQRGTGKSAKEGFHVGNETNSVEWFGESRTDRVTGGSAGGGRVVDAKIFLGSDEDEQEKRRSI